MRNFETGATRDSDEGKLHFKGFLSPRVLRAFAEYMEEHRVQADGNLRDPDNWKKGMPLESYEDSFIRHVMEWWELIEKGDREGAMKVFPAILFNIQGWAFEMLATRQAKSVPPGMMDLQKGVAPAIVPEMPWQVAEPEWRSYD